MPIKILRHPADLYRVAAETFVRIATQSVAAHGRFGVALAGGSTPRSLYGLLVTDPGLRSRLPIECTHFYWGDERHVPPEHADSNYRMANEVMLSKLPLAPSQVHRIHGEHPDVAQAADEYERELCANFALAPGKYPRFDLVLLGIGPDAHTASLFPHTPALDVTERSVAANRVAALGTDRITLTIPAINNAANIVFLVSGADKAVALREIFQGPHDPRKLPAQSIAPHSGTLTWLVDEAAGAQLRTGVNLNDVASRT